MSIWAIFRNLISLIVAVSITTSAFASPLRTDPAASAVSIADAVTLMAQDMPCQKSPSPGNGACPFLVLCSATCLKIFSPFPSVIAARFSVPVRFLLPVELQHKGIAVPPLARPPRPDPSV